MAFASVSVNLYTEARPVAGNSDSCRNRISAESADGFQMAQSNFIFKTQTK
jgi:hypothetical protein